MQKIRREWQILSTGCILRKDRTERSGKRSGRNQRADMGCERRWKPELTEFGKEALPMNDVAVDEEYGGGNWKDGVSALNFKQ